MATTDEPSTLQSSPQSSLHRPMRRTVNHANLR
jgi:hypothetical protein